MKPEKLPVGEAILVKARWRFRDIPQIKEEIRWINESSLEFRQRIGEFDDNLVALNRILSYSQVNPEYFRDVIALKGLLPENIRKSLPTLQELVFLCQSKGQGEAAESPIIKAIEGAFEEIHKHIQSRAWRPPTSKSVYPYLRTSKLIIDTYGIFLEKWSQRAGLANIFSLAFEEVLFTRSPDSALFKDILPWMFQRLSDYPSKIRHAFGFK